MELKSNIKDTKEGSEIRMAINEDEKLEEILEGFSASDNEPAEPPVEVLINHECYEERLGVLKRKLEEERMEHRASMKMMKEIHDNEVLQIKNMMKDKIECPVCLQVPRSGPVYVCPNGHFVCKDCRQRSCPTCRTPAGNGKSLLAITVIENIDHDCQFDDCKHSFPLGELEQHEKLCPQRTVACPDVDCRVQLPLSKLVDHLSQSDYCCDDELPTVLVAGHDWICECCGINDVANLAGGWLPSFYSFDGQTFAVIPSKSDGQYHFAVVMFDTRHECGKYKVEIVAHQAGTEATASDVSFSFCGNPSSIDDSKDEHAFLGFSENKMKRLLSDSDLEHGQFNFSFRISRKG